MRYIIPIEFNDVEGFNTAIDKLNFLISAVNDDLAIISFHYLKNLKNNAKRVVFAVKNNADLQQEIKSFQSFLTKEKSTNEWQSIRGSYFTHQPVGKDSKICFINPPANFFEKESIDTLIKNIPEVEEYINNVKGDSFSEHEETKGILDENIFTEANIAALDFIGVQSSMVVGASLGELTLPGATNSLDIIDDSEIDPREIMVNLINTICETSDLILEEQEQYISEIFQEDEIENITGLHLKCNAKTVQKYIDEEIGENKVYITIICSPEDVIITGSKKACKTLISKLQCLALEFEYKLFAHTPMIGKFEDTIRKKVSSLGFYVTDKTKYNLYSNDTKKIIGNSVDDFANHFVSALSKQINMPELFEFAYDQGMRVFIDLGSKDICTTWIKDTLTTKDYLAFSMHEKMDQKSDDLVIFNKLIAHNINFNIDYLLKRYNITKEEYQNFLNINQDQQSQKPAAIINNQPATLATNSQVTQTAADDFIDGMFNQLLQKHDLHNYEAYTMYLNHQASILNRISKGQEGQDKKPKKDCLYDYDEVLEMTNGSMAKVLGEKYKNIDKYAIRARMPSPPFLFVTRILKINAEFGKFQPGASIEAEYIVPEDCIYKLSKGGDISVGAYGESAHIGIFLAGYMGIDEISGGKLKYRIANSESTQLADLPKVGDTMVIKYIVDKYIHNGGTTMIFCRCEHYHDGKLFLKSKQIGGFFTQEMLDDSKGVTQKIVEYSGPKKKSPYKPIWDLNNLNFTTEEIRKIQTGRYEEVLTNLKEKDRITLATDYDYDTKLLLTQKLIKLTDKGGIFGLGNIICEGAIDETHWAFGAHFKNDPIFPGTLMLEGIAQTMFLFCALQGLYSWGKPVKMRNVSHRPVETIFRGQVKPEKHILQFRLDPKTVQWGENTVRVAHDSHVFCDGVPVIKQIDGMSEIYVV